MDKEKIINKSINAKPFTTTRKRIKVVLTITFVTGALLTAATFGGAKEGIKTFDEQKIFYETINNYKEIITKNTHTNPDGKTYRYDNYKIAAEVVKKIELNETDPDIAIYCTWSNMSVEKEKNMDVVLRILSSYSDYLNYESFEEYMNSLGFVDESGKIDTKAYGKAMKNHIVLYDEYLKTEKPAFAGGIKH